MISILVCSRIQGNRNTALTKLLDSLVEKSSNFKNFEVLIKFDDDDKGVQNILPKITKYPFHVKYLIEPRCRGYVDLHIFYNRLFSIANEKSVILGAMGEDFILTEKGWDELLMSKTTIYPDGIFLIHGRPHPPYQRTDYEASKFFLDYDIDRSEDLAIIDEAPFWSRKLLDICGGLGHLSFTDLWTLMLEYYMFHRCGLNRTIFTDKPFVERVLNGWVDLGGERWLTSRASNFEFAKGKFYKTVIESQAVNIFTYIKAKELNLMPAPMVPKHFTAEIPKLEPVTFSQNLKMAVFESAPIGLRPILKTINDKVLKRRE